MKSLHTATAVIEIASGILLLVVPSMAATFLFGAALTTSVELALARMTGVALLALGAACWLLRNDAGRQAGRGLVGGMVIYNVGVAGVLAYSSIGLGLSGIGLWPAVLLHAAMTVWSVLLLRTQPAPRV
jgi:hypothetical protein